MGSARARALEQAGNERNAHNAGHALRLAAQYCPSPVKRLGKHKAGNLVVQHHRREPDGVVGSLPHRRAVPERPADGKDECAGIPLARVAEQLRNVGAGKLSAALTQQHLRGEWRPQTSADSAVPKTALSNTHNVRVTRG